MSKLRIAVLGAGANGASIGADLTRTGHDVTLIEQWPEHVRAMRERGAKIVMPEETITVPVRVHDLCEVATFTEPFDVVLLLVKAYDSRWAAELIRPYVAPDGMVVGVQNGMSVDEIAAAVGRERTMGCVIEITSMMFEPGIVERHSPKDRSWFAVGSAFEETAGREAEIADLLREVGTVEVVDDILSAKWMKLVSNSTTLVTTAILGIPMIEAAAIPEMRRLMLRSGQEALQVGVAAGYRVLPIFGLAPAEVSDESTVVETLLDTLLGGFVLPSSRTTILQDWLKGRHSEVDDINGRVVALGRRHGVDTPANAAVVELAHRIERHEIEPGRDNLAALLELAPDPGVSVVD
ncbi:ketopantoate reductase family protein [Microbacterium yannicii]|uniref:ketopantoate reductase family protein n=1 Tax=Microbacterium yannicii TaxID=671622 RepID=UPI0003116343|nr:2-dehydropantoate 2-reductase [Microbacterium yannicii]